MNVHLQPPSVGDQEQADNDWHYDYHGPDYNLNSSNGSNSSNATSMVEKRRM